MQDLLIKNLRDYHKKVKEQGKNKIIFEKEDIVIPALNTEEYEISYLKTTMQIIYYWAHIQHNIATNSNQSRRLSIYTKRIGFLC